MTLRPSASRRCASLPMVVVLPAPLMPTTRITKGLTAGSIDERALDRLQDLHHRFAAGPRAAPRRRRAPCARPGGAGPRGCAPSPATPTSARDQPGLQFIQDLGVDLAPGQQSPGQSVRRAQGPAFNLARRRLKKPRTPGLSCVRSSWVGPPLAGMMRSVPHPEDSTDASPCRSRNAVRIIGGAWRGRRVRFPTCPAFGPRPTGCARPCSTGCSTTSPGVRCLDLFAGSGALGLEALSRGAREVVFVEASPAAARAPCAPSSASSAGLRHGRGCIEHGGRALPAHAGRAVRHRVPRSAVRPGRLARISPPACGAAACRPGGLVYLECERAAGVPALPAGWELLKSKSAGEVGYHLARGV